MDEAFGLRQQVPFDPKPLPVSPRLGDGFDVPPRVDLLLPGSDRLPAGHATRA
jgi:hypothetical protein